MLNSLFGGGVQAPLQDGITEVGMHQFANDEHQPPITFATIPSSVTVIRYGAFQGCRQLTTVTIPSSVKEIEEQAFWSCNSLSSVNIPASVEKIGIRAFLNCGSLTSIDIPSSVTTIGDEAFSGCSALKTATIPSSATLGKDVFPSGTQVTVKSCPPGQVMLNQWSLFGGGVQAPLQDGITEVGEHQFVNDKHKPPITFATIPSSVTVIRKGAFQGCRKLTTVTIPTSVKEIGEQAFWSCDSLSSVNIPASVRKIGKRAFRNCGSLTSIDIPSSVTSIGDEAFSECYALKTATIPSSATLGKDVFESGTQVTVVSVTDQRAGMVAAEMAAAAKRAADEKAAAEKAAAEKAAAEKAAAERAVAAAAEEAAALRRELEAMRAEKAAAEKAAAERAESATVEPAFDAAAQLEGLKAGFLQILNQWGLRCVNQWGLRSDAPAAGSAPAERRTVRLQLPESWNAEEYFAVPGVITEQMTQTVKSRVLSQFMPEGVQFKDFYPEVVISYASGRRSGRDCDGAGPGMYYAAGILGLLHERGVRCFSGLHVPPGTDWEVFMLRLNSRRARAKVLIVVLTAALFQSKPCLKEINAAIKNGISVLPIRFEDSTLPGKGDQWAKHTDEESEMMIYRVQEHLGKINSIPHPGTVLTVPDSMNTILGLVDKYLGIDRVYVSPGSHGDDSYEA